MMEEFPILTCGFRIYDAFEIFNCRVWVVTLSFATFKKVCVKFVQ
jgi:hypothetical protein